LGNFAGVVIQSLLGMAAGPVSVRGVGPWVVCMSDTGVVAEIVSEDSRASRSGDRCWGWVPGSSWKLLLGVAAWVVIDIFVADFAGVVAVRGVGAWVVRFFVTGIVLEIIDGIDARVIV